MRLIVNTEHAANGGVLHITDDKSSFCGIMTNSTKDKYSYDITLEPHATPEKGVVERLEGESDEIFFDRACVVVQDRYLEAVSERIAQQSLFEQAEAVRNQLLDQNTRLNMVLERWELESPDKADVATMRQRLEVLEGLVDKLEMMGS